MIRTAQTLLALDIAKRAHFGQTDKGGHPYILHPMWVAEQMDDELSTVVALLHDVVEDTSVRPKDLLNAGISERAVQAIKVLTWNEDVSYFDYVENIKTDPIAKKVKLADLAHNTDESRIGPDYPEYLKLKYRIAKEILSE